MEENYNLKQLLIIMFIIVSVLLIFYGITIVAIENRKTENENNINEEVIIDYETILVKDIYNQNDSSYYVLATLIDDTNVLSYQSSIKDYKLKEKSLNVYEIDLSSAFNKKYLSEESNFEGKFPIFKETTLLKIENKKIVDIYEGKEDIDSILQILTSEE